MEQRAQEKAASVPAAESATATQTDVVVNSFLELTKIDYEAAYKMAKDEVKIRSEAVSMGDYVIFQAVICEF